MTFIFFRVVGQPPTRIQHFIFCSAIGTSIDDFAVVDPNARNRGPTVWVSHVVYSMIDTTTMMMMMMMMMMMVIVMIIVTVIRITMYIYIYITSLNSGFY